MAEHGFISARDEPAERWCVAKNAVRHADAMQEYLFFTNQVNAPTLFFLKYVQRGSF
jgi:2-keto-4-pentenoate hydratase/2-oxohepta-3-ene-1,7-dioic acid hydratase in catechol pathway